MGGDGAYVELVKDESRVKEEERQSPGVERVGRSGSRKEKVRGGGSRSGVEKTFEPTGRPMGGQGETRVVRGRGPLTLSLTHTYTHTRVCGYTFLQTVTWTLLDMWRHSTPTRTRRRHLSLD